jgi:hypothetical protein
MTISAEAFCDKWAREWILHRGLLERLMLEVATKRMKCWNGKLASKNFWIWGKPGIRKSRWADQLKVDGDTLKKSCDKWWCGMDVGAIRKVIIEDYPPLPMGDIHAQNMKIWCDRYLFRGETKGSSLAVEPGKFFIIVTSNYHPQECFSKERDLEARIQRFTLIEMNRKNEKLVKRFTVDCVILQKTRAKEESKSGLIENLDMQARTHFLKHSKKLHWKLRSRHQLDHLTTISQLTLSSPHELDHVITISQLTLSSRYQLDHLTTISQLTFSSPHQLDNVPTISPPSHNGLAHLAINLITSPQSHSRLSHLPINLIVSP